MIAKEPPYQTCGAPFGVKAHYLSVFNLWPRRLAPVRTLLSQGGKPGSNPGAATNFETKCGVIGKHGPLSRGKVREHMNWQAYVGMLAGSTTAFSIVGSNPTTVEIEYAQECFEFISQTIPRHGWTKIRMVDNNIYRNHCLMGFK